MFEASRVRLALDELLDRHPSFDLVKVDWQLGSVYESGAPSASRAHAGPWVLVEIGQPSENFDQVPAWAVHPYAIWKSTGALYAMTDGMVTDDPIWSPVGQTFVDDDDEEWVPE